MSKKKIAWILLSILCVALIWNNSLQDAPHSEHESLFFVFLAKPFLNGFPVSTDLLDHIIRKCAHVFEYSMLGCVLSWTVTFFIREEWKRLVLPAGIGLCVASIDEFLQLFSPGRGAELRDVGIDFTGVLIGCAIVYILKKLL